MIVKTKVALPICRTNEVVEKSLGKLKKKRFPKTDISESMQNPTGLQNLTPSNAAEAPERAVSGVCKGAVVGGVLSLLAGISALIGLYDLSPQNHETRELK